MQKKSLVAEWLVAALLIVILGLCYVSTMARTIMHIDCGELIAAQWHWGVAHPTGYPLFTLLGYLFLKLPLFERPVVQANILSVMFTISGLVFFAWFLQRHFLEVFKRTQERHSLNATQQIQLSALLSAVSTLMLGFNLTVWAQANATEVYSLQIMLISLMLLTLQRATDKNTTKAWMWAAIAVGAGFTNHMTTLMILPAAAYLFFRFNGFTKASWQKLLVAAWPGILVILVGYIVLYLRAQAQPIINWGHIHDFTSLKRHITGHQYSSWIFAGTKVASRNLREFLSSLQAEYAYLFILVIPGAIQAWRLKYVWSVAMMLAIVFNVGYVINYDIKDLEPYFLTAHFGIAFFLGYGMLLFLLKLKRIGWAWAFCLLPIMEGWVNFAKSNNSHTSFFEEYTRAAMHQVEAGALIMTEQWDFFITPYYYLRYVENAFSGTVVVDRALLRRSWYIKGQLPIFDSTVLKGCEQEVASFLHLVQPFEDQKPYNASLLEAAYQDLINAIIQQNVARRPVYLGREIVSNSPVRIPPGYKAIPYGLWIKLVPAQQEYVPYAFHHFQPYIPNQWRGKNKNAYYSEFILSQWKMACNQRKLYELQHGHTAEAALWEDEAAKIP